MSTANSNSEIAQRAFLVGCPRSGTTLLQSMLVAHPQIASFPETHFFDHGFGGRKRWIFHETLRGWYLWFLLVRWRMEVDGASFSQARQLPFSWSKGKMANVFCEMLDRRAHANGADIWIEKTPRHLHYVDVISQHVPSARFVHIVRDGRAVVASLHRLAKSDPQRWGTYRSVDAAIDRWNRSIRDTRQRAAGSAHVVVAYDELVRVPERVMNDVTDFFGVAYDATMIEGFSEEADRLVKSHESWKEDNMRSELEHRGLETFYDEFSEDDRTRIDAELSWEQYRSLGFEPL